MKKRVAERLMSPSKEATSLRGIHQCSHCFALLPRIGQLMTKRHPSRAEDPRACH
jgi:hypothetical protein